MSAYTVKYILNIFYHPLDKGQYHVIKYKNISETKLTNIYTRCDKTINRFTSAQVLV